MLHCKRKTLDVSKKKYATHGAYIENDMLNFSMHNSTNTQNVLRVTIGYSL